MMKSARRARRLVSRLDLVGFVVPPHLAVALACVVLAHLMFCRRSLTRIRARAASYCAAFAGTSGELPARCIMRTRPTQVSSARRSINRLP